MRTHALQQVLIRVMRLTRLAYAFGVNIMPNPTQEIADARAASGHAMAAPPPGVMNSRRLING